LPGKAGMFRLSPILLDLPVLNFSGPAPLYPLTATRTVRTGESIGTIHGSQT
jgi:hypothetical protein